jgi:hypothetical protein
MLPKTVQAFKDANNHLQQEPDKKKKRKLKELATTAKRNITPHDMADAINQIPDNLLKAKVAGLVSFELGEKCQAGMFEALDPIMRKFPRKSVIEPEPKEVYDALVELGFSHKESKDMSTPPKED